MDVVAVGTIIGFSILAVCLGGKCIYERRKHRPLSGHVAVLPAPRFTIRSLYAFTK